MATKKDVEVVSTKKKSKKSVAKAVKAVKAEKSVAEKILGLFRTTSNKGILANHLNKHGKITETQAARLIEKKKPEQAVPVLQLLRRSGKKHKAFKLFPSTKHEGLWLFKKGAAA